MFLEYVSRSVPTTPLMDASTLQIQLIMSRESRLASLRDADHFLLANRWCAFGDHRLMSVTPSAWKSTMGLTIRDAWAYAHAATRVMIAY